MVILIPKGQNVDLRGIGLVEVIWKTMYSILNRRLMAAITFHDVLHGLWEGRGTGNATLKANLIQHLTAMREEVLFEVVLDI